MSDFVDPFGENPSKEELHRRVDTLAEEQMRSTGKKPDPASVEEAHRVIDALPDTPSEPPAGERGEQSLPPLVRASDLIDPEDQDQGDFEPGGFYKGFKILPRHLWPANEWTPRHAERWGDRRFYVTSENGTCGLVPWEGSLIIWPWDRAWTVDLHRTEVETLLKEEKKERKK